MSVRHFKNKFGKGLLLYFGDELVGHLYVPKIEKSGTAMALEEASELAETFGSAHLNRIGKYKMILSIAKFGQEKFNQGERHSK